MYPRILNNWSLRYMNLKDFVKKVVTDLDGAVNEARTEMERDISFTTDKNNQSIKFDIAVSVDETKSKSGKAGVRVLEFAEAGANLENQQRNSTISRVSFGLYIAERTKQEQQRDSAEIRQRNTDTPFMN